MAIMRSYLKDIERDHSQEGRLEYLRLDMNENPEGLPEAFFRKVMDCITPQTIAAYPELAPLKRSISTYLGIPETMIMVTNGSDDAIYTVFDVFGERGKEVVSVYPTFAMYMVNARIFDMKHVAVDYNEDMTLDVNKVHDAINENTRIVAMLNPNNPIGNVYSEAEVRRIVERAAEVDAIVVIDEAYHYFYDKTFLSLVGEYKNIVLTRTFSKLMSIAGLRIGYVVSNPNNIMFMQKVKPTYNVNQMAIIFANAILNEDGLVDELISIEREGRLWIIEAVKKSGRDYYAENGNYIFIRCITDRDTVVDKLRAEKVLVKKYDIPLLRDYIRISTGSVAVMKEFWTIFEEIDSI